MEKQQSSSLLTTGQVSKLTEIPVWTLRRMVKQGLLKCERTDGGQLRFSTKHIRHFRAVLKMYRGWNLPVPATK